MPFAPLSLETERLRVTEYTPDMARAVHLLSLDAENRRFLPDEVFETEADARAIIAKLSAFYARGDGPLVYPIFLKDGTQIGHVEASPIPEGWEIGYHLGEAHRGRGYAAEAVRAFAPAIMARLAVWTQHGICVAENAASRNVLEKAGFRLVFEGISGYQGKQRPVCRYELHSGDMGFEGDRVALRPETPADFDAIDGMVRRSFREGTMYSDGTDVAAFIREIRASPNYLPELSFVAEVDGRLAGYCMFSRFPLSDAPDGTRDAAKTPELLMLGPVAVSADHLRRGVGAAMLRAAITRALGHGERGILLEGNFRFYERFGFRSSFLYDVHATSGFPLKEPRCQMLMETASGSLAGVRGYVVYDMYENA